MKIHYQVARVTALGMLLLALATGAACGGKAAVAPTVMPTPTTTAVATHTQRAPAQRKLSLEEVLELAQIKPDSAEEMKEAKYVKADVHEQFQSQLSMYLEQQRPIYGLPVDVKAVAHTPIEYISFLESPEQHTELVQRAEAALAHGLNYWKHDKLHTPKTKIIVPKSKDQIQKEQPNDGLNIYAVKEAGTLHPYTAVAYYPNGASLSIDLVVNETTYGEAPQSIAINVKDGRAKVVQTTERLLWVIDESDPLTFTTPALEVLHVQFNRLRLAYLVAIFKQNPNIPESRLQKYAEELTLLEELMVHGGMGLNWKYKLNEDWNLGLTQEQIIATEGWANTYPRQLQATAERVNGLGLEQAVNLYATDIHKFFEGIVTFTNN